MILRRLYLPYVLAIGISVSLPQSALQLARAADVFTQHNNNARTGATLDESVLNTSNVNSAKFGKLWTLYTDGQVVAQPLYISKLSIDTSGNPKAPLVKGMLQCRRHCDHAQYHLRV